ncbi:MAG: hypothetical protein O9325_13740 [Roseomonas sp.]|nr:hypothetical protein [Roseomonas sp.]
MLRQQIGVLAQPVAGTLDLHDDGVMEQAVQQRRGDNGVAENLMGEMLNPPLTNETLQLPPKAA